MLRRIDCLQTGGLEIVIWERVICDGWEGQICHCESPCGDGDIHQYVVGIKRGTWMTDDPRSEPGITWTGKGPTPDLAMEDAMRDYGNLGKTLH